MDSIIATPNLIQAPPAASPQAPASENQDFFAPALATAISDKTKADQTHQENLPPTQKVYKDGRNQAKGNTPADETHTTSIIESENIIGETAPEHEIFNGETTPEHEIINDSMASQAAAVALTPSENFPQQTFSTIVENNGVKSENGTKAEIQKIFSQHASTIDNKGNSEEVHNRIAPMREQAHNIQNIEPVNRGSVLSDLAQNIIKPVGRQQTALPGYIQDQIKPAEDLQKNGTIQAIREWAPAQKLFSLSNKSLSSSAGPDGNSPVISAKMTNDIGSISWTQNKSAKPHVILNSNPLRSMFVQPNVISENVSATGSGPLSTESIIGSLTDLNFENKPVPPLRNQHQSLRQAISGQFIDAKLQQSEVVNNQKTSEQNLDTKNESTQQNTALGLAFKPSDSGVEPAASFSQTMQNLPADKTPHPLSETFRPGSGLLTGNVFEDNILNQVAQKFRINQLVNDSKIMIKLHPAELGQLKIDIQIKEGAVNASILAQSQQVQEILEKHMPRLKALMEENGLKINEIVVAVESDVSEEFNLFEEHLSQDDDLSKGKDNSSAKAAFTIPNENENIEEDIDNHIIETGVNVKV